ncbi:porphobilinogen deaminase [Methanolacinia petrolearia DSM 11571]|uniref:Hydroxymethylbilane synthase n=1 Tax=Methanolacinia petrolearia (strain DSM 11571 / OCM 486 / SEBR 4847) TaxID=679926 RepID=E1RG48_METP4|nr:hydroxymethylbilane synthase [Methanolacinia petrolearia]ADN36283.1 porphobilinogen deaminase [Methanolacinia petrolearia DSM 11571]
MSLIAGTRASKLALAQTKRVSRMLYDLEIETQVKKISTSGDNVTNVPLHKVGGQGIFVKALDDAILEGEIDFAVHSMKDIPAKRPDGVVTCAILKRDSPADFLVHYCPLKEVKIVGTSSTRRRAQFLRGGLDVEVKELRGNVDTRIRKLKEGEYDAIVLAEAGMERLGLDLPGTRLLPQWHVPSPNQGIIAVVCRDDPELIKTFEPLNHEQTRMDASVERAVMEEIGGGCYTPQGVFCEDGFLIAEVLSLDGKRWERIEDDGSSVEEARLIGQKLRSIGYDIIEEARLSLGL